MADGVKISSLTEATDAQMTDAGLIEAAVADTGSSTGFSSKKSSFGRLAGYILNKFSGLSLAGASQTVKAAIDSLNSNTYSLLIGTAITSGADLNAYTTAGNFYSAGSTITNSLLNAPFTGYGFKMHVEYINSNGTILQTIASGHTPSQHYERRGQRASGSWTFSDWEEQPTRAEIDSLNSNLNGVKIFTSSITANASKKFTVESNSRILAVVLTNQAAAIGAFGISVTSGGSVYRQKIGGGESIDIPTTAANSVTFTHSASSGGGIIAFICFSGSASEA